jgi:uncharacterized membrane protein YdjX (TVP38/TMEM64 family)
VLLAKQFNLPASLQPALEWVNQQGAIGVLVYIAIYVVATVCFFPGSLLTLGGGAIYGLVWGSLIVFLAASLGATLAFLIGRYLAREWVTKRIADNPKFGAIDAAIAREGRKIVTLTRLSPVFPFVLLNYALGLTQVSLLDYVIGCLGMIPGTVMYVYLGSLAGNLATIGQSPDLPEVQRVQWVLRIVGLVATIVVSLYIARIAKNALEQSI